MYIVVDLETESRCMTFDSFAPAQTAYFRQWRDKDGSIPWKIFHGDDVVDPNTGYAIRSITQ